MAEDKAAGSKASTPKPADASAGDEEDYEEEVEREAAAMLEHDTAQAGDDSSDDDNASAKKKSAAYPPRDSVEYVLMRIKHHAKYVPMRLTMEERKLLRLLEAALNVSEYTDKVDILSYTAQSKRIIVQLREMCAILAGLVVATNMQVGRSLFEDKDFAANAEWYQAIFEIGRRYKIMNPEKMRDSFGKLMYMIMDSRLPEIKQAMEFDFYKPIRTVYSFLQDKSGDVEGEGVLRLFDDPLIVQATMEIIPENKSRVMIQREIKKKESAIKLISKKYASNNLFRKTGKGTGVSAEDICQCLYSIGDYHAYLRSNRHPVEEMIQMLNKYFDANTVGDAEFSLGISMGRGGARLSHNHTKQFHYVHQSLTLWSIIMQEMFWLWSLADDDLTSTNTRYSLADTGQGLNRVKACPRVGRAMHTIISKAQSRTGSWIGSSVVHLGDRTVPNALFFLDKYLQVPRILTPVFLVIKEIEKISRDPFVHEWIENQFGSVDGLKKTVLCDFFKHGFDGSGADNFYDAGSCIDGRLTSAWSWANSISKKPYYKVFLVAGFTGFNGSDGF